mgnify:CR=1 FL=1
MNTIRKNINITVWRNIYVRDIIKHKYIVAKEKTMKKQYLFTMSSDLNYANERMLVQLKCWLDSPELKKIVLSFGGDLPAELPIKEKLSWLLEFSDRWDYRRMQKTQDQKTGENARWKVNSKNITPEQEKAVAEGIFQLGLTGVQIPECKNFDYVLALGGARFSCFYRPQYAAELLKYKIIKAKEIALLSGMRPILESEREATDSYAPQAETEYDLINSGGEKAFHLKKEYIEERYHNENVNLNWAVRKYLSDNEISVSSFSGPSSDPENRRANSSDTYKFFLKKKQIQSGSKLLLITSQIYVPYQQIEAVRTLGIPYGLYIETVGFPIEWGKKLQGMMETANYLQEIRSTIQAANRFINSVQMGEL